MKKYIFRIILFAIVGISAFTACEDGATDIPDVSAFTSVYLLGGGDDISMKSLPVSIADSTIKIGMCYGGGDYNYGTINAKVNVDLSLVDSYNEKFEKNYQPFPLENLQLTDNNLIIPDGVCYSNNALLKVSPLGLNLFEDYMLPVTMSDLTGNLPINEKLRTIYYVFNITVIELDRTGWTIAGVSSEETVANPQLGHGFAANTLDNNPNTEWHSAFDNGLGWAPVDHPHWIAVDMKESKTISGFMLLPKQEEVSNPLEIEYFVSDDNETWISVGTFTLSTTLDKKYIPLAEQVNARYFKMLCTSSTGGTMWTHVSELGAF